MTHLSVWTHSSSPVTGAGLWVSTEVSPWSSSPGTGGFRTNPHHIPSNLPGGWQVSGEAWGPVRTLGSSRAREGFWGVSLPVSHGPSPCRYLLQVVSNTQQTFADGAAGMEFLPWVLLVVSFFPDGKHHSCSRIQSQVDVSTQNHDAKSWEHPSHCCLHFGHLPCDGTCILSGMTLWLSYVGAFGSSVCVFGLC